MIPATFLPLSPFSHPLVNECLWWHQREVNRQPLAVPVIGRIIGCRKANYSACVEDLLRNEKKDAINSFCVVITIKLDLKAREWAQRHTCIQINTHSPYMGTHILSLHKHCNSSSDRHNASCWSERFAREGIWVAAGGNLFRQCLLWRQSVQGGGNHPALLSISDFN